MDRGEADGGDGMMVDRSRPHIGFEIAGIGFANFVLVLCQFVVLWGLARYTDLETVGRFGLVMAVIQPTYMLARMGFRGGLSTDIGKRHAFETYFGMSVMLSAAAGLAALGILALFRNELLTLALPLVLAKAAELVSNLFYGGFQRDGESARVARSILLRCVLGAALFMLLLANGIAVERALWAQTVMWSIVLLLHDLPLYARTRPVSISLSPRPALRLLRENGTLGLGQFMSVLQMSVPRILIELLMGTAALGLFTVVAYLQQAAIVLFDAIGQVVAPRLARYRHAEEAVAFRRLLSRALGGAMAAALCGVVLGLLIGPDLLVLLFGPDFIEAEQLLMWVVLAVGLRLVGAVLQAALTAQRRFDAFGLLQAVLLVASLPAAWIGVTFAGLAGAGMALVAMAGLRLVLLASILRERSSSHG